MHRRTLINGALFSGLAGCLPSRAVTPDTPLDLDTYVQTFSEEFEQTLDVTATGPSRWTAHTPWNGDFGDARLVDPEPEFPFRIVDGQLHITAAKRGKDKQWQSGLLASQAPDGRGFTQKGGYFEARMKLPPGPGVWPAFWLGTITTAPVGIEIDVVEYYGHSPAVYVASVHRWPKPGHGEHSVDSYDIGVPANSLCEAFHTYGVDITASSITFYLDRKMVARAPAPPGVMDQESLILLNLALGPGWPIDKTPDPSVLIVDYVRAYQPKDKA